MGGQMPDTCPRCRAFLVSGRADCPFCGAEAAAIEAAQAAAIAAAPDPRTSAGAPRSWAAPDHAAGGQAPPPGPRRGGVALKAIGILAAVVGVAALVAFLPDPGDKPGSSDDAAEGDGDVVDQLAGVCEGKARPIAKAKAYKGGPGFHQVAAVMIPPGDNSLLVGPDQIYLEGPGWRPPEDQARLDVADVELVGCYVVSGSRWVEDCSYQTFGANRDRLTIPLTTTWGRVVVREARTGKEVLRQDVPEVKGAKCWGAASTGDTVQIENPEGAIRDVLRRVNDGTEPSLPVADQAAKLCAGDVVRAVVPADRPIGAVTVMVRTGKEGPFEPLAAEDRLALPPEFRPVPAEQAGTVLCLTIPATRTDVIGVPMTLATGADHGGMSLAEGTNAKGELVLPWLRQSEKGLSEALAAPRS